MAMTQSDIQSYYQDYWKQTNDQLTHGDQGALTYSSPIEDPVIYPIYEKLINNMNLRFNNARVLDIGSGSGRWIRFILNRYTPETLNGIDFAESSVHLLNEWAGTLETSSKVSFQSADITDPNLSIDIPENGYDTINIANVLFHIPEPEKFQQALVNLSKLIAPDGRIITTEYLPRTSMRTQWMSVRSRYEFEHACHQANLEIVAIEPCSFFSNDPMGIDGPDHLTRNRFNKVRAMSKQLIESVANDQSRDYLAQFLSEIEHACIDFCNERISKIDFPAQKLVVLQRAR